VVALDCRVQYQKGGDIWHRPVSVTYEKNKIIAVQIDDQPVHTFNRVHQNILTSVDGERVQIEFDKNKITWRSSLRDRDFGVGVCVKTKS